MIYKQQASDPAPFRKEPGVTVAQLLGRLPWFALPFLRSLFLRPRFDIGISPLPSR